MANKNYKEVAVEILKSMKTQDNGDIVDRLISKIEELSDEKIDSIVNEIGATEENIRNYLQKRIHRELHHEATSHKPINQMFTYGITGSTIHLHLPSNLNSISLSGLSAKMDQINLYLLDALKKIQELQQTQEFEGIKEIYMISPILLKRELVFLEELGFSTTIYSKKELQDEEFVRKNPESQLATSIFGNAKNVGRAKIGLDVINSKEWQDKAEQLSKDLQKKLDRFSQDR